MVPVEDEALESPEVALGERRQLAQRRRQRGGALVADVIASEVELPQLGQCAAAESRSERDGSCWAEVIAVERERAHRTQGAAAEA
eukprot:scaffold34304_cov64-Phaeocystis_antarctica.AAC.3